MPPVTDLLICVTSQAVLEWDHSSTNEAMKVEMTKALFGPGLFMTHCLESWYGRTKEMLLMDSQPAQLSAGCMPALASFSWERSE